MVTGQAGPMLDHPIHTTDHPIHRMDPMDLVLIITVMEVTILETMEAITQVGRPRCMLFIYPNLHLRGVSENTFPYH